MAADVQPSRLYLGQSRGLLKNHFPFISVAAIDAVFRSFGSCFTETYNYLKVIESQRDGIDGDGAGLFIDRIPPNIRVIITSRRKIDRDFLLVDDRLVEEVNAIPELCTKHEAMVDAKVESVGVQTRSRKSRTLSRPASTRAKAAGIQTTNGRDKDDEIINLCTPPRPVDPPELVCLLTDSEEEEDEKVECKCCYMDCPASDMKDCQSGQGHFVCRVCINHYVGEQLDGNGSTLFKCIADPDCQNHYTNEMLDQEGVLDEKLNARRNDRVFRDNLKSSGIEGVWQCPVCAYCGLNDEKYPWVECPMCEKQYCTSCDELYHKDKTCEQARIDKVLKKGLRQSAHEAMSQASKRVCPHCSQEYQKSDGCNKIRCKCGGLSCYLCSQKITGYDHFSGAGATCQLWTNTDAMAQIDRDRRHAAGRKVLLDAGVSDEEVIKAVLASPAKKTHQAARPAVPAHPVAQIAQLPRRIIRALRPQAVQPPQINQPRQPQPHAQPHAQPPNAPRNNAAYDQLRVVQVQQRPAAQLNNNQALLLQPQVQLPIAPYNNVANANGPRHVAFAEDRQLQPAFGLAREQVHHAQGFAHPGEGQFGADRRLGEAQEADGQGQAYEARDAFAQQARANQVNNVAAGVQIHFRRLEIRALQRQLDFNRLQRNQFEARLRHFQQNLPLNLLEAAEVDRMRARINANMITQRILRERYERLRAGNM